MPKYLIQKEVTANNITQAIQNEKLAEIMLVEELKEEENKQIGFHE